MNRFLPLLVLVGFIAGVVLFAAILPGCGKEEPTTPYSTFTEPGIRPEPLAQYWGDRIVSEAFYALDVYRTGTSNVVYHGLAMSDWNYVESDRAADLRVSYVIGSCANRGAAGGYVDLTDTDGSIDRCHRGGQCKFFATLVLYRSSYGWGGGQHLGLPSGYSYGGDVHNAQPGWVLQAPVITHPTIPPTTTGPHTAIVVAVYSWGLDVVDSNWTAGDGQCVISRHGYSWSTLAYWGFTAYNPWANPVYIAESGPTRSC